MDMFFDTCHVLFVKGLLIPVIGFVLACGNLSCFLLICFDICFDKASNKNKTETIVSKDS